MSDARGGERTRGAERRIGRLLIAATYVSVALLLVGVVLMLAAGHAPLDGGPGLDLGTLGSDILALVPGGFLWLKSAADQRIGANRCD